MAAAAFFTSEISPPNASHDARKRRGRILLPPCSRAYEMGAYKFSGVQVILISAIVFSVSLISSSKECMTVIKQD
jgi:hypothetical protein